MRNVKPGTIRDTEKPNKPESQPGSKRANKQPNGTKEKQRRAWLGALAEPIKEAGQERAFVDISLRNARSLGIDPKRSETRGTRHKSTSESRTQPPINRQESQQ